MSRGIYRRFAKRCIDVGVAAAALTVLTPVAVVVAAAVRVTMGWPVVFAQRRPGMGGKTFTIYKFRTMTDARDKNGAPLSDDQRLTKLGLLLRKTSLDEIPQLLNVLLGEMSLVGPRPLLPQYLPWYSPREATRHDVRPGITGWAQINGRNAIAWDRRLELDAWYVENVSAWLDLKIAIATIAKVVRRSGVQADNSAMFPLDVERRAGTLESDARNAA
jgi:sugar transferase EpsL